MHAGMFRIGLTVKKGLHLSSRTAFRSKDRCRMMDAALDFVKA
jgi:hypothetical protein